MSRLGETRRAASLEERFAAFLVAFERRFGPQPGVRCFFAPGRVNLMGAHLDYNGGPVMPTAIDRGTFIALRPRSDGVVKLASTHEAESAVLELAALPTIRQGSWYDYPTGVLRALVQLPVTGAGQPVEGADVLCGGNLPIGAGLSSSASICVGVAHAFNEVWGLGLDVQAEVEAALWAEREYVGVRCGIMDPYAVGMTLPGHLLWLDCKDNSVEHVPLDPAEVSIVVADTGVRRKLAQGAFNERVSECRRAFEYLAPHARGGSGFGNTPPSSGTGDERATCLRDVSLAVLAEHESALPRKVARRARHVLEEVERTFNARAALQRGDLERFGQEMFAAHESLRELFEVSVPELDLLVDAAKTWDGVLGARLTGAGFGGCTVTLVRRAAVPGFAEHLRRACRGAFSPKVEVFHGDSGPREVRR